jgi:CcmD family protein
MEDLLKTILLEVRNLSYLFFGYAVIWLFLFGYIYSLSRRERDLRNEIERLKAERIEDQAGKHD